MEIVKQELNDLEWSARLNLDPDRGDEEGKGGKYLEKGNVSPRRKRRGEERKRRTIFGPQNTKRTEKGKEENIW